MDILEKAKAKELIEKYLSNTEDINTINSVSSQLEEITLNGKEFIELIKKPLKQNYISKWQYDKILERYDILKERDKF
jgi:hypothetical protein